MARDFVIGVDPGRRGAVAVVEADTGRLVGMEDAFSDDPSTPSDLHNLFAGASIVVVERPLAYPGIPAQSLITLAESSGAAVALARCAGVRTLLQPTASQWKRALGVTSEKRTSIDAAMRLFELEGCPPRHDLCEAALLAWYGYLWLQGSVLSI